MVKKIPFKVIFVTDEQTDFPASELNTHGPTVQGWRSNPENTAPKEIILKLDHPARITKIQVLAHQFLIPERIELWIHYSPQKCAPCTPSSQSFDYMGFVSLSDNSSSNYQSRELQSVSVEPKVGTHLKLRIGPAYENPQNPQRQAALLAVNVLGEEIVPRDGDLNQLASQSEEPTYDSICDDLSFCMYVEESVAEVVRQMETLKHKAVQEERFEYARKLKLCMTSLRSAGERLGRYALAKRQAVQLEDFNAACLRKEQIEMYRNSVFELLQVEKLLEKDGLDPDNDMCSELYTSKPVLPSAPSLQDVANVLMKSVIQIPFDPPEPIGHNDLTLLSNESFDHGHQRKSSLSSLKSHSETPGSPLYNGLNRGSPKTASPTPSSTGSIRRRNKSLPRNTYDDYDEREIPTLRHSQTNEYLKECYAPPLAGNDDQASKIRGRSKLNDRERRQASLPILVFGNEFIEMFYSRQFQDREDGLTRLRNILKGESMEVCTGGPNKIARAATFLLHRCVRDVVFSVFAAATETIRTLFMDFVPNRVSVSEVSRLTDKLLPELLTKTGDPSPRVHNLAQHTILTIADCPQVRDQNLVTPALARTISSGTHPRLALSRLQMLEQLILSQGLTREKSSLTIQFIEAGISGIHHPAEHVRKVAERILLLIYKNQPRLVRKQLPPDDDITRRNLLYRQLFSEFDKIDADRRKDMSESKMMEKSYLSIGTFSPPLSGSSRSSPPVDVKFKQRHENRNSVSFAGYKTPTNEINSIDPKLLKSKSGNAIDKLNQFLKDVEVHSKQNGAVGGSDKSQFVSKIPQSKARQSSRSKDSYQNGNSLEVSTPVEHQIICTFCDWTCSGNDAAALDRHYWKTCPILTKCPQCSLILEIAALNSHLINECDAKESYLTCERCFESVHKDLYEYHLMEDYCIEVTNGADRCPLCHDEIFLPMEGGWRRHLLGKTGCRGNPRTKSKL